ncbi:MAG TPA: extracellular solute-binding protein [Bacillota bacterium]|nr:extracellular solute-binding protein [Bacillota bacterium]HOA15549.1 extracellular solute-binding protein [Bacillota bacterium]HOG53221.1 extracellular solute-binding protein [Bacillota bacterium]
MKRILVLSMLLVVFASLAVNAATTKLMFWEQDDPSAQVVMDQLIAKFEKAYPDVKVERSHFETEDLRKNFIATAIGSEGPDVVFGPNDNLGVFVPGGFVLSMEKVYGKAFLEKKFDANALEASKYEGEIFLLPDRNGNELCLIYNKKLIPTAPKTMEELIATTKKLQAEKKVDFGVAFNTVEPFFTVPFLGAFDTFVLSNPSSEKLAKPTLDLPGVGKMFAYLKGLMDDKIAPRGVDYGAAEGLFKEGKVACLINGPWSFAGYVDAGMSIGVARIPSIAGKYPTSWTAVKGYCISAGTKKLDLAKKFVDFMTSTESQILLVPAHNQIPTTPEAMESPVVKNNVLLASQAEPVKYGVPMPIVPQMRACWDALKAVQADVFSNAIKPEEAPAKAQKLALDALKQMGINIK